MAGMGRLAFIEYLDRREFADVRSRDAADRGRRLSWSRSCARFRLSDLAAFVGGLQREPWLLGEAGVGFQVGPDRALQRCAIASIHRRSSRSRPRDCCDIPAAASIASASSFAFTYAHAHLIPVLTRIWPLPDDLPHAAGMGNLCAESSGGSTSRTPALGDLDTHHPATILARGPTSTGIPPTAQQVLDVALAWAVINSHFEVADFLLEHGADINTNWSTHEPASILHELVCHGNYEAVRFLIDRGIDMTIDYRWSSTAEGWARYAAKDEKMAQWLEDAERQRESRR